MVDWFSQHLKIGDTIESALPESELLQNSQAQALVDLMYFTSFSGLIVFT